MKILKNVVVIPPARIWNGGPWLQPRYCWPGKLRCKRKNSTFWLRNRKKRVFSRFLVFQNHRFWGPKTVIFWWFFGRFLEDFWKIFRDFFCKFFRFFLQIFLDVATKIFSENISDTKKFFQKKKNIFHHTQLCVMTKIFSWWIRKTFILIVLSINQTTMPMISQSVCIDTSCDWSDCITRLKTKCLNVWVLIGTFYKDIERKIFYILWKNFPHSVRTKHTRKDKQQKQKRKDITKHTSYCKHLNLFVTFGPWRHCEAIAFWSKTKRTESFYISVERSVSSSLYRH